MYNKQDMEKAGINIDFVQDNQSCSTKGVLRGMHFQTHYSQGKLVRVLKGEVFDVAVDMRKRSSTFLKWYGIQLSDVNFKQLYIPEGFAHGFLVLSDIAEVCFKVTNYHHPEYEIGFAWNDPAIGIQWHGVFRSDDEHSGEERFTLHDGTCITLSERDRSLTALDMECI